MVNPVKAISKAASSFRAVRFKARASGGAPRGIVGRRGKIPTFLALRRLTPRKRLLFSGVRTRENFGGLVNHQAPKPGFCVSKTPGFVQPARRLSAPSFKAIFAFLTQKNGGFLMARARIIPPRNAKKNGNPRSDRASSDLGFRALRHSGWVAYLVAFCARALARF